MGLAEHGGWFPVAVLHRQHLACYRDNWHHDGGDVLIAWPVSSSAKLYIRQSYDGGVTWSGASAEGSFVLSIPLNANTVSAQVAVRLNWHYGITSQSSEAAVTNCTVAVNLYNRELVARRVDVLWKFGNGPTYSESLVIPPLAMYPVRIDGTGTNCPIVLNAWWYPEGPFETWNSTNYTTPAPPPSPLPDSSPTNIVQTPLVPTVGTGAGGSTNPATGSDVNAAIQALALMQAAQNEELARKLDEIIRNTAAGRWPSVATNAGGDGVYQGMTNKQGQYQAAWSEAAGEASGHYNDGLLAGEGFSSPWAAGNGPLAGFSSAPWNGGAAPPWTVLVVPVINRQVDINPLASPFLVAVLGWLRLLIAWVMTAFAMKWVVAQYADAVQQMNSVRSDPSTSSVQATAGASFCVNAWATISTSLIPGLIKQGAYLVIIGLAGAGLIALITTDVLSWSLPSVASVGAIELLPALAGGPSITAQSVVALAILLVKASFPVDTLMYLSLWLISWRLTVMRILVGAIRAISWLRF
jgi:hypothetical protein